MFSVTYVYENFFPLIIHYNICLYPGISLLPLSLLYLFSYFNMQKQNEFLLAVFDFIFIRRTH